MTADGRRGAAPFVALLLAAVLAGPAAAAAEYKTFTTTDGAVLEYALALPEGFDAARTYPVLVALPPGGQGRSMVEAGLPYFEAEGVRRGYIVVSPAAPARLVFFRGGASFFPEFLEFLSQEYNVAGGKFHLTGIFNGGLSAFRAALDRPDLFHTLTVLPGFPPAPGDEALIAGLAGITITMFAGETDTGWVTRMDKAAASMRAAGLDVHYEVVLGAGHVVRALAGADNARMLDLIER